MQKVQELINKTLAENVGNRLTPEMVMGLQAKINLILKEAEKTSVQE